MKTTTTISLLSVITTFIHCINLSAQSIKINRAADMGGGNVMVTINESSAMADNLFTIDSVDRSNKMVHVASFDLDLGSDDSKKMLNLLLYGIQGKQLTGLVVRKLNYQNNVIEQRSYQAIIVKEILLPELNPASKETVKATITIEAQDMPVNDNVNSGVSVPKEQRTRTYANHFKLAIGNLPAQRVLRISNLSIKSASKDISFTLDIPVADTKPWIDWFNTGAGGIRREDATISLVDATNSKESLSFQLPGVEIVSVSTQSRVNTDAIASTTIGLRTRSVSLSK